MKKYVFEICIKRTYPAQSRGENHTTITAFYGYKAYRVVLSAAFYHTQLCCNFPVC